MTDREDNTAPMLAAESGHVPAVRWLVEQGLEATPAILSASKAGQTDVLLAWAEKLEESMNEAKLVDGYKMQVNLDGDEDDKPVNQKVAAIIKEGYMRKKKPGNSKLQDMKRSWERRYMVLYNDGKLRYYDSKQNKKEEKGSLDLRFFALQARRGPPNPPRTALSNQKRPCFCRRPL